MSESTAVAAKKKLGPKHRLAGGQRKNVYLDDASIAEAMRLGGGEVSVGIRIALQRSAEASQSENTATTV